MATTPATPRDLDPNAKDKGTTETVSVDTDNPNVDDSMIVHKVVYVDPETGQPAEKLHGPMPRRDWPAYEKEHNL